jgi:hypothetical protein
MGYLLASWVNSGGHGPGHTPAGVLLGGLPFRPATGQNSAKSRGMANYFVCVISSHVAKAAFPWASFGPSPARLVSVWMIGSRDDPHIQHFTSQPHREQNEDCFVTEHG